MFNDIQIKAILILLDDKGHAGWELAENIGVTDGYLHPQLKELVNKNIIIRGERRKSQRKKKREGDYEEIPYYIKRDLDILKIIVKELQEILVKDYSKVMAGFLIKSFLESNYSRRVKEECGLTKFFTIIKKELGGCCSFFKEYFPIEDTIYWEWDEENGVKKLLSPIIPPVITYPKTELDLWYAIYLSKLVSQPDPDQNIE